MFSAIPSSGARENTMLNVVRHLKQVADIRFGQFGARNVDMVKGTSWAIVPAFAL